MLSRGSEWQRWDADEIIVASAGPHPSGSLPPITHVSGGLESAEIRKAVCEDLSGLAPASALLT
jgi:hypothetical protein